MKAQSMVNKFSLIAGSLNKKRHSISIVYILYTPPSNNQILKGKKFTNHLLKKRENQSKEDDINHLENPENVSSKYLWCCIRWMILSNPSYFSRKDKWNILWYLFPQNRPSRNTNISMTAKIFKFDKKWRKLFRNICVNFSNEN